MVKIIYNKTRDNIKLISNKIQNKRNLIYYDLDIFDYILLHIITILFLTIIYILLDLRNIPLFIYLFNDKYSINIDSINSNIDEFILSTFHIHQIILWILPFYIYFLYSIKKY